jgi:hypothetical protein
VVAALLQQSPTRAHGYLPAAEGMAGSPAARRRSRSLSPP